jgi:class 3 adenylate cyclase
MMGAMHLVLYGPVQLAGSWLLYRPIARGHRDGHDVPGALERIGRLTWRSTGLSAGVGFLTVTITLGPILVMPDLYAGSGEFEVDRIPASFVLASFPPAAYVFCIFPAFVTHFLVNDFVLDLRARVYADHGVLSSPGRKRIAYTILSVLLVLGLLPLLLVILELAVAADTDYAKFTQMDPMHTVIIDRFVTLVGIVVAVVLVTRSFTKPIHGLLGEIGKVKRGELDARASIITDDEIGTLTREFNEMVKGLEEKEFIRAAFGRYVTPDVARAILERRIDVEGEVRTCTVLVTDIAGYTTLSEEVGPQEVVRLLNEYFSEVVGIIQRHRGVVNKFIGDAVFAMFNVPLDDPDHAANAIRAALEIQAATGSRTFGGGRKLGTRIGVNTGVVLAGNIGSAERLEYTVIGDAVNVAARLEQLNKEYGTTILAGETTVRLAGEGFPFVHVGEVQLKGKSAPSSVFGVGLRS